jgi:hypothetical protein
MLHIGNCCSKVENSLLRLVRMLFVTCSRFLVMLMILKITFNLSVIVLIMIEDIVWTARNFAL